MLLILGFVCCYILVSCSVLNYLWSKEAPRDFGIFSKLFALALFPWVIRTFIDEYIKGEKQLMVRNRKLVDKINELEKDVKMVRRSNHELAKWKVEIDVHRHELNLEFPEDYDKSPKYAVQTLVDAAKELHFLE